MAWRLHALRWMLVLMAVLCLPLVVRAETLPSVLSSDEPYQYWPFRRSVLDAPLPSEAAWGAFPLRPDWKGAMAKQGRDLRIVAFRGNQYEEVPFWVQEVPGVWNGRPPCVATVMQLSSSENSQVQDILDFGATCWFDRLDLDMADAPLAATLSLAVAEKGPEGPFVPVAAGARPFVLWEESGDKRWVHRFVRLPRAQQARFVRFTWQGAHGTLQGAKGTLERGAVGTHFSRAAWEQKIETRMEQGQRFDRYWLQVPRDLSAVALRMDTTVPLYRRVVRLLRRQQTDGEAAQASVLAQAWLYRWPLPAAMEGLPGAVVENDRLPLPAVAPGEEVVVEIAGGVDEPRIFPRFFWESTVARVVFPVQSGVQRWLVYYGNSFARSVVITPEKNGFSEQNIVALDLGKEAPNTLFRVREQPAFAYAPGETVDVRAFQYLRKLPTVDKEDLYWLELPAEDLALLRGDRADLRIVDDTLRSIPFARAVAGGAVLRLVAKLRPAVQYTVLLGSSQARAPLVQTLGLYQEYLARQALPLVLSARESNPAFRLSSQVVWQGFGWLWLVGGVCLVLAGVVTWVALRLIRGKKSTSA